MDEYREQFQDLLERRVNKQHAKEKREKEIQYAIETIYELQELVLKKKSK